MGEGGGRSVSISPLVTGVRWTTLGVGLLLAAFTTDVSHALAWGWILFADALLRTVASGRRANGPFGTGSLGLTVEVLVAGVVVVAAGGWSSPFIFSLLPPVVSVGFRAGYLRHLLGQAEQRHSVTLGRMTQLSEANDLLVSLHRVVQTLPASLDLEQVLRSTLDQLRNLIASDVAVVLVLDDVTGRWRVGASDGAMLGQSLDAGQLPAPLRAAAASSVASLVVCLAPGESLGPAAVSRSGLYAPLRARGALVGLIALEHHEAGRYDRRDLRLLDGFTGPAALGIDNAAWFARLRAMGAEEERTRIARDMHDSVGQSLAYLAFKLDRITNMAEDARLRRELEVLRGEVRGVLTEVREALCDLRTDVNEEQGLVDTLQAFLSRVRSRTELEVTFHHEEEGRLPMQQERELWRIAHEAVTNVEHHAGARHLHVRWQCDGRSARLTVGDDGRGFPVSRIDRTDRYGITGMKERASAIGATLAIESEPFVGTLVECLLERGSVRQRETPGPLEAA